MIIANGNEISEEIINNCKKEISTLNVKPCFAAISIGEDASSKIYLGIKEKKCKVSGIDFKLFSFDSNSEEQDILELIKKLNEDKNITGIMVQLPLPTNFDKERIIKSIDLKKDVDCLRNEENGLIHPTIKAILFVLNKFGNDFSGKNIVLVGYGELVGKPLSKLLIEKNPTLTICNKETKDLSFYTKNADIIITATGQENLIKGDMIKEGVILIDAGVTKIQGKIKGDVDFNSLNNKPKVLTPVPGGIGPITVAMLIKNILELSKINENKKI